MERKDHINFWYVIIAFSILMMIQAYWGASQHIETIPYSKFEELLKAGAVKDVAISSNTIIGTLKEPAKDQKPHFSVVRVDPNFAETLEQYGVEFNGVSESNFFSTILSWIIPAVIFVVAGRAAESIAFSEVSTGPADDLKKATDIARSIVTRFGMDETPGNVSYEDEPTQFLSVLPAWRTQPRAIVTIRPTRSMRPCELSFRKPSSEPPPS